MYSIAAAAVAGASLAAPANGLGVDGRRPPQALQIVAADIFRNVQVPQAHLSVAKVSSWGHGKGIKICRVSRSGLGSVLISLYNARVRSLHEKCAVYQRKHKILF